MKHDELCIHSRINQVRQTCGVDSLQKCYNPRHFKDFKDNISYNYNSRGFRDDEWPDDLSDCIFVVGASSAQGTGLPFNQTWTYHLQQLTGKRVIVIALYSASNDWIARKVKYIAEHINPTCIIALWVYMKWRENPNITLSDEKRRYDYNEDTIPSGCDLIHFRNIINATPNKTINALINLEEKRWVLKFVPGFDFNELVPEIKVSDYARDFTHYGPETSKNLAVQLLEHIT